MLVRRLGLRSDVRRWPLFGLGCAGGAGALTRACDVLEGAPRGKALVIAVELLRPGVSTRATTPTDIVGAALFGDGAAAALVGAGKGPRIVARRNGALSGHGAPDGLGVHGRWDATASVEGSDGLHRREAEAGGRELPRDQKLSPKDIAHWVLHPGGRRIIETYHEAFGLSENDCAGPGARSPGSAISRARSILFILSDLIDSGSPKPGERGLMCALGPGFASELLILEW